MKKIGSRCLGGELKRIWQISPNLTIYIYTYIPKCMTISMTCSCGVFIELYGHDMLNKYDRMRSRTNFKRNLLINGLLIMFERFIVKYIFRSYKYPKI